MITITLQEASELIRKAEELDAASSGHIQQERLTCLVDYARKYSPLFRELYSKLGNSPTLDQLPVTEKKSLIQDMDNWFTDREVSLEKLEEYLHHESDALFLGKYSVLTTSGTTGKPLLMVRDSFHNTVHGALLNLRLFRDADVQWMNPANSRIAAIIFTNGHVSSYSSFKRAMKNSGEHAVNMIAISTLESLDKMVAQLNEFRPDVLTGYPSVLVELAHAQVRGELHIAPKLLACSAEKLSERNYHLLRKTFSCTVLNNYCSTEGGEIAMSCSEGYLHVNSDWIILEPVDESLNPVEDGKWSDGVLITDLTNFVQPVIRYHVGDRVRFISTPCKCGSHLPRIDILGRVEDSLCLCGKVIPGAQLMIALEPLSEITNYQLLQTSPHSLEFRGTVATSYDYEAVLQKLKTVVRGVFENAGCTDAEFIISSAPPVKNHKGGKVKRIVNLVAKE